MAQNAKIPIEPANPPLDTAKKHHDWHLDFPVILEASNVLLALTSLFCRTFNFCCAFLCLLEFARFQSSLVHDSSLIVFSGTMFA